MRYTFTEELMGVEHHFVAEYDHYPAISGNATDEAEPEKVVIVNLLLDKDFEDHSGEFICWPSSAEYDEELCERIIESLN